MRTLVSEIANSEKDLVSNTGMKNYLLAAVTVIVLSLSTELAYSAEWGLTSNELRSSITVVRGSDGEAELEWTVQNVSPKDFYLTIGKCMGTGTADQVRLIVRFPDGVERTAMYTNVVLAPGRITPVIVPLLSNSAYTWKTKLRNWIYHAPDVRRVDQLLSTPSSLRMELRIGKAGRAYYRGNCYPLDIFWTGILISNVMQLPRH